MSWRQSREWSNASTGQETPRTAGSPQNLKSMERTLPQSLQKDPTLSASWCQTPGLQAGEHAFLLFLVTHGHLFQQPLETDTALPSSRILLCFQLGQCWSHGATRVSILFCEPLGPLAPGLVLLGTSAQYSVFLVPKCFLASAFFHIRYNCVVFLMAGVLLLSDI